jgi:hypothetical protein
MLVRFGLLVSLLIGCHDTPKAYSTDDGESAPDAGTGSDPRRDAGPGSNCGGACPDGGTGGTIAFGEPRVSAAGSTGYFVTAADLNGDNLLDLVESSPNDAAGLNEVHILRGAGTGAFTDVELFATSAPNETIVSDFTGDGIPDIAGIAADGMGPLPDFFLQGQGNFAYAPSTWGNGRDFNQSLRGGDFNEDGTLDLVAPYFGGFVILQMPGFVVVQDVPDPGPATQLERAVAGDFDGDGHQDVMFATGADSVVHFYRGNGSGTVALAGDTTLPGGNVVSLAAFDLDRDGRSDLVAIHAGGTATVSYGTATGLGSAIVIQGVSAFARGIAAGDFDGDGRLDLAIGSFGFTNGTVDIWRNTGPGFAFALTLDVAAGVGFGLASADFNGDGRADLAVPGLDVVTIYLAVP